MAPTCRAIYCTWNVGYYQADPAYRTVYSGWNVGVELVPVAARAIYSGWNVGIAILIVLARAIHSTWAVTSRTSLDDPVEWRLLDTNLITVLHILRG
jgi:hypothetical protein